MQNLPITPSTQPVTSAQAPGPADNNATQAAESFDSVLARQRANANEPKPKTDAHDKSQPTSSSSTASPIDNAPAAAGNEPEIPAPDAISIPPGDMLAALLPAPASGSGVAANEKSASQAPTPDGVSTLPSDMLAMLLSAPSAIEGAGTATRQQTTVADTQSGTWQQPTVADVQGGIWQQPIATDARGGIRQQPSATDARGQLIATGAQGGAGKSIGEQTATSLFRVQGNIMPTAAATDTAQGKTFSATLEALNKDAANTALQAATAQTSAQAALPDAITLSNLAKSTTSPIAAGPNGPMQTAINTPVTHDAWGNEFNQKVTWLATQHEQTAELHLNPPHLGPLDVVLNISGDQATALFTSPHAAVREAVEQAMPKLREMLADNGIMLGNATVNDQSPKEQPTGQADKQPRGNTSLHGAGDPAPSSSTVLPARRHQGMVDTFA